MALYNMTRFVQNLLKDHENSPPSFTVKLYREYWILNNGSKFLYNNQIASLLDDIRTQRIPVDFLELFDAAKLPFYEGCLIVELLDYRPAKSSEPELEKPEMTRVVLTPTDESRWADICLLNQTNGASWTDADALEVEARLLLATAPPLCLEPDIHLTRIVNATQRVSTPPAPLPLKRKAAAMDQEADDLEKARRLKLMQFMSPQRNVPPGKFPILDAIQRMKQATANAQAQAANGPPVQPVLPTSASPHPTAVPTTVPAAVQNVVPTPTPVAASTSVPTAAPTVAPTVAPVQTAPPTAPTPVPSSAQFHRPPNASSPAPASTPTPGPASAASPQIQVQSIAKKPQKKKSDAASSPRIARASATPAPTAPTASSGAPLPIPAHLQQHYQAQMAQMAQRINTPAPTQSAPSPRPGPVAHASSPPAAPEQRPPSAVPTAPAQPVQQIQAAQQRAAQPSPTPNAQQVQQQPVPGAYTQMANPYIAAAQRRKPPAGVAPNAAAAAAAQSSMSPAQMNYLYQATQAAQAQAAQQRLNQAQQQGAAGVPATSRSPMPTATAQAAAVAAAGGGPPRNSPMNSIQQQQQMSRSPMPNAAQQAQHVAHTQQQAQAQAQAQPQHAQHAAHQNFLTAQYMAHMRQLQNAQQHPQMQQYLAAAAAGQQAATAQAGMSQQQQSQQQQQQAATAAAVAQAMQNGGQMMAPYPPMYNFSRVPGMPMGHMPMSQIPPQYWQLGAGRGMPVPGGQQVPNMPGHPQQMEPGAAAKPAQGGQQQGS